MKNILITILFVSVAWLGFGSLLQNNQSHVTGNSAPAFYPTNSVSSSTTFTLGQTSLRLLATTTGSGYRIAASIQPVNCTLGGTLFISAKKDKAATTADGPIAFASSTGILFDQYNYPTDGNSIQGVVNLGTCTVIVTEWKSQ